MLRLAFFMARKTYPKKLEDIAILKERFLAYYAEMPIKRYAAYSIGRNEDTTLGWERTDPAFSERIDKAKAAYLLLKAKKLQPSFIVPLLFRELTPRTEVTGAEGEALSIQVIAPSNGSAKLNEKAKSNNIPE